jgi:hypothetical protein
MSCALATLPPPIVLHSNPAPLATPESELLTIRPSRYNADVMEAVFAGTSFCTTLMAIVQLKLLDAGM